jgi:hypothetical protein
MFNFFKKKHDVSKKDLVDENGNLIRKSSVVDSKNGERFLKLDNDTCAIILHPGNNVEVVFTKLYDPENQVITPNEESLMALALFMKQPGFLEMMISEFRKIAMERISALTDNANK